MTPQRTQFQVWKLEVWKQGGWHVAQRHNLSGGGAWRKSLGQRKRPMMSPLNSMVYKSFHSLLYHLNHHQVFVNNSITIILF